MPIATHQMVARWMPLERPAPAEDPQAQEGGLEEEGQEGLDSQGSAENVTDEAGVLGPVHAELELLDDASGDAESEVNKKELTEEAGSLQPVLLAGAVPCGLHDRDQQGQADRQRYEDEVVDGRDTELPPSDRDASSAVCARVMMGPSRVGMGDRSVPQQEC